MPIIKSAKKRAKQALVRQARNYNVRTAVRKSMREIMDTCKTGDQAAAEKLLPKAYKAIDTAAKKNVMTKNTAARRKSLLARTIAGAAAAKKKADAATPAKRVSKKKA